MDRLRRLCAALCAVLAVVALCGFAAAGRDDTASSTFVVVRHGEVQSRSLATGGLRRVQARGAVAVASAGRGSVIVARRAGCSSRLADVDSAGRERRLRTLRDPVRSMALSPDGHRLAYLAYPGCGAPSSCHGGCPDTYLPATLAIVDLRTGRTVRTTTDKAGHAIGGLSWSPDGSKLVTADAEHSLLVIDSRRPSIPSAPALVPTAGCSYFSPAWTRDGIVAADGCGRVPARSPAQLVLLNPERVSALVALPKHVWPLPRCVGHLTTGTDLTHSRALVQTDLGYGDGACAGPATTRIADVRTSALRPILTTHAGRGLHLVG